MDFFFHYIEPVSAPPPVTEAAEIVAEVPGN
jgi:hypothetical protein